MAIATDAYLPKHPGAGWLAEPAGFEYGPQHLLALITRNGAAILGLNNGSIEPGRPADLVLAEGVPGLEVTGLEDIRKVFIDGELFRDG